MKKNRTFDYIRLYVVHTRLKRKSLSLGFDAARPEINHHATIVLAHATRALSRDTVSLSFPRNPIFPFINSGTSANGKGEEKILDYYGKLHYILRDKKSYSANP